MLTLILGGAASGKSAYAESLAARYAGKVRYYIATMQATDGESVQRIEKHRAQRAGFGFETVECYTGLHKLRLPERGLVLLDCLGNLVANELYTPEGAGNAALPLLIRGVEALAAQTSELLLVSNEVFCGGSDYLDDTLHYLKVLADLHRAVAQRADAVCEVIAAQPHYYKGREPRCD